MYFTRTEFLANQEQNLFLLDTSMHHNKLNVEDIADFIPGYMHVNQVENYNLQFTDRKCEEYLKLSPEEMIKMGDKLIQNHFHPSTLNRIITEILEFGNKNCDEKNNNTTRFFKYFLFHMLCKRKEANRKRC